MTSHSDPIASPLLSSVLNRRLIFIHGKGGVGKTAVSRAIAQAHAEKEQKTLWITLEDPTRPLGELKQLGPSLWHLNCDFTMAFEEYASMKIGIASLTRLFLKNKVMRYLAKAAPGIHELVLLGKIWFERTHYSHVVVDLPSTGYGLAMFQSTENFAHLFKGGPLHRDAEAMLDSFRNPEETGHLIVALPEEMPLRESLDLNAYLEKLLPGNPAVFLVNRLFPKVSLSSPHSPPHSLPNTLHDDTFEPSLGSTPLPDSLEDYVLKRWQLENYNLRIWREAGLIFGRLEFVPPPRIETGSFEWVIHPLTAQLTKKGYL